jgi:hypothetical protein
VIRSVADRGALAIGVRVQLSWVKHAPYTQRADLAVSDRLAVITARDNTAWIATDDAGEHHRLEDAALEVAEPDPARGRWRIEGAIPAYRIGERLRLHWRHRSPAIEPDPPRDDCDATVVAEAADVVTVRLDDGSQVVLARWGAQIDEPDRQAPRWFVAHRLT